MSEYSVSTDACSSSIVAFNCDTLNGKYSGILNHINIGAFCVLTPILLLVAQDQKGTAGTFCHQPSTIKCFLLPLNLQAKI